MALAIILHAISFKNDTLSVFALPPQMPGVYASLLFVGVHGGHVAFDTVSVIVNALVYFLLIMMLTRKRSKTTNG